MKSDQNLVLIIDDEPHFIKKMCFAFNSFTIDAAINSKEALKILDTKDYDLILLDLNLNINSTELDGLKLINPIKTKFPDIPLVVVTSDDRTETIVTAMKKGADDFLRKSEYDMLSWKKKFDLLIENSALNNRLRNLEEERFPFIGNCNEITEIKRTLKIMSRESNATILIAGETGVGKEVAARYLHRHSPRRNKPFITVNLPAIPDNLLESTLFGYKKGAFTGADFDHTGLLKKANKGILFLDEIGEINQSFQLKLLRFLDTKRIQLVGDDKEIELDVQIITATNKNISELVNSGQLRNDLYYRLKHMVLEIPPLRMRGNDVQKLIAYYLERAGYQKTESILDSAAYNRLLSYNWPGNVRELRNTIDYMLLRSRVLKKKHADEDCLPSELRDINDSINASMNSVQLKTRFDELDKSSAATELEAIESALRKTYGQKQAAAQLLSINMDQMRYRVFKYWNQFPELVLEYPTIMARYKLPKEGRGDFRKA